MNTAIVLGAARGIILKLNRTMLVENGGHVDLTLTKAWAKGLLGRMDGVREEKGNNKQEQKSC